VEHFEEARRRGANPLTSGAADALGASKKYEEAFEILAEGERSNIPYSVMEARVRRAALHLDRGQIGEARRIYEETLVRAAGASQSRWAFASLVALAACLELEGERERLVESLRRDIARLVEAMDSPEENDYETGLRLGLLTKIQIRNFGIEGSEIAARKLEEQAGKVNFKPWRAYVSMLRAEGFMAGDEPARAESEVKRAIAEIDLFQLHETLARALRAQGKLEEALTQYRWILEHRGQAFAESSGSWSVRELALLDWALAHVHAAGLEMELGREEEARASYRSFLDHWSLADVRIPALEDAKRRAP
jgi:tetratricopeptide (TPR) repeat protein